MGEPTRIVVNGFPHVPGDTMMEKKEYIAAYYDAYRQAILLEPRGHTNMFGAILMAPVHAQADAGVVFMDSGGYLNMCGHGSIGVATVLVDMQMVDVKEPYTDICLDTPSGLIRARVKVERGRAVEVTITNVPCFLYRTGIRVTVSSLGEISLDIAFGGSFFALVDADALGLSLQPENIRTIIDDGMDILQAVNAQEEVHHPLLDIHSVDLVEFYGHADVDGATMKNVFGDRQIDRSPCGTGTSAKVASLYLRGKLKKNELFVYESIMGTLFKARVVADAKIEGMAAAIPQITGSAYITGINCLVLDKTDPFCHGFHIQG